MTVDFALTLCVFFSFKDIFVEVKSLSSFMSVAGSTLEQHLWPSSVKFGKNC